MNLIFLDFYGTITGSRDYDTPFSPRCCRLVDELCEEFNAKIVITSDSMCCVYNSIKRIEKVIDMLVESGIKKDKVMGFTHQRYHSHPLICRAKEIKEWLEDFSYYSKDINYVIFDDLPLPFSKEHIEERIETISKWKDESVPEYIAITKDGHSEESYKRFIHIEGRHGITKEYIEKARKIFDENKKDTKET